MQPVGSCGGESEPSHQQPAGGRGAWRSLSDPRAFGGAVASRTAGAVPLPLRSPKPLEADTSPPEALFVPNSRNRDHAP